MTETAPRIVGLVPDHIKVRSARIILEALEVQVDVCFHDFEVGVPQRLLVSVEIWLDDVAAPAGDDPALAWNYDVVRKDVERIAAARRYNLQETLAHALFDCIASRGGVKALRIRTSKPDIYASAHGVGVEISSFEGLWPKC